MRAAFHRCGVECAHVRADGTRALAATVPAVMGDSGVLAARLLYKPFSTREVAFDHAPDGYWLDADDSAYDDGFDDERAALGAVPPQTGLRDVAGAPTATPSRFAVRLSSYDQSAPVAATRTGVIVTGAAPAAGVAASGVQGSRSAQAGPPSVARMTTAESSASAALGRGGGSGAARQLSLDPQPESSDGASGGGGEEGEEFDIA